MTPTLHIDGGTFAFGDDHQYPEEAPALPESVAAFRLDVHPVTNAQFAAFVDATGYVTAAEREGGAVFTPTAAPVDLAQPDLWWMHSSTATWRQPRHAPAVADHPVVQVTRTDAEAYAAWVGGRLPTEIEWEWAASAGGRALPPTWPLAADGLLLANVWLGEFPWRPIRAEPPGTMPVGSFPPNAFGLYDMLGQVWEWTSDGVVKGGSFLCVANYCARYRPAARQRRAANEPACHVGFRCAYHPGTADQDG